MAAAPQVCLEHLDQSFGLKQFGDVRTGFAGTAGAGVACRFGNLEQFPRMDPAADHAPEAVLQPEPGLDKQLHCIVRYWPLERKPRFRAAAVIAHNRNPVLALALGEGDLHRACLAKGDALHKCAYAPRR